MFDNDDKHPILGCLVGGPIVFLFFALIGYLQNKYSDFFFSTFSPWWLYILGVLIVIFGLLLFLYLADQNDNK